jgi:hypothetical protein
MEAAIPVIALVLGAVNALGTLLAIWRHCKSDIEKRAVQNARLDALEKR